MIACVLVAFAASLTGVPIATTTVDRDTIRLSDTVRVTLTLEGTVPLRVEMSETVVDAVSAEVWHVRPDGPVRVAALPDGRERWSRTFRADPFVTGSPLRLGFVSATVAQGTDPIRHRVEWPPVTVTVTTNLGPDAEPRSITGIEELPLVVESHRGFPWLPVAAGLGLLIGAGGIWFLRHKRTRQRTLSVREDTLRKLDTLRDGGCSPVEFAESLNNLLRHYLEQTVGIPTGTRTLEELVLDSKFATLPVSVSEPLLRILTRCDTVRFAGQDFLDGERHELVQWTQSVIASLSEVERSSP